MKNLALMGCAFAAFSVGLAANAAESRRFERVEGALRAAFAGAEGSFQCERALKRLEMAKRLEEPRFAAVPTQADELEMFGRYFEEEMSLWKASPFNPSVTPRRLNVADFGAKGDGVTDDAPAFAKAIAAARALKGAPAVVEIPEGTYFLRDDCGRKDGFRAHVVLEGCTNLALVGASPEKTQLVFGDDEMSGLMLAKCDNVCVRNLDLHWQKTPFTQGRIESYDVEKGELVIRLQDGTLRPDDPYYKHVSYPELCCSAHRDDGSIVLGALAFWDLRCEDLGDGRFKLFLVTKHANYRRAEFPVGAHAVIPARCGKASACYIHETSRFCAFDSVWVRNAPSAGFIAFGEFSSAYRCRVFPLRPEYKLSTDADAFFNASGAHVSHCEFRGMNDDAANSHTTGKPLIAQPDERTLSYPAIYRETRPGDVVQVFQSQTGKALATLHAETSTCVCTNGQWVSTTRFRERIPDGILTGDSPGVRALSKKERYDLTRHGGSLASVKMADLAFQPLGHGLGYIVCDNVFRSFRGICVNSQCPNTLVENNLFENVNNGVQLSALMNWREGVPPHGVVIRNNVFTNLLRGVAVSFIAASGARGEGDPFVGVAVVSNRFADVRSPLALGAYARDAEVWGNAVSRPVPATENERSVTMFVAITGKPTPADAERKLDELKAAGVDSFMFYPTSGMRLEYLGDEFFALARAFAAGAERRGMKMWLYDEYNWPSGSCRGRVPAEDDRFRLTQLSVHAAPGGGYEWKKTLAAPGWVNLLEPQAVRRFIERTHLEYERRLGRWILNGTVRGIFTDEPGHPGPITLPSKPLVNFRWYDGLEADYRAATGRDFRADVEAWVGDHGKGEVWRGYAKVCGRRFRESYYDQIRAVTDRLGIAFTGHMIYDDRMDKCVLRNGDPLRAICGESFPGIDEILSIDRPDRIPFNLYAIADFATRRSGTGGMCELFACGPADMPPDRIRRLIWLCALHGITRYFTVMSWMDGSWMEKMRGFTTTVGEYQPWYREFRTILDEADRASACAAKTPIRDVAVRYPQDLLAEAAFDPAHAVPAYDRLLAALELGGLTPMVVAEDETTDLPIVLAFDRKGVFDERTARRFASVEEAADFVAVAHPELPRRRNVLVRRYADGTRAELDLNPPDLALPAGEDVKADWKVTFDGPKRLRIPFGTNRTVRVRIPETVKGARLVARHHRPIPAEEEDGRVVSGPMCTPDLMSVPPPYRFAMDGKPVETPNLTEALVPSYNSMYRETEPFDLPAGEHEFSVLSGRDDVSYFVPSLFLVGDFGGDSLKHFAGRITYAAEVEVPAGAVRLAVDAGNAMTRVTLGGVDLGTRGWAPFAWTVPVECRGRKARLEIAVYTSVWPMYGEPLPGQSFLKLPGNLSDETSDPGLKGCRFVVEKK